MSNDCARRTPTRDGHAFRSLPRSDPEVDGEADERNTIEFAGHFHGLDSHLAMESHSVATTGAVDNPLHAGEAHSYRAIYTDSNIRKPPRRPISTLNLVTRPHPMDSYSISTTESNQNRWWGSARQSTPQTTEDQRAQEDLESTSENDSDAANFVDSRMYLPETEESSSTNAEFEDLLAPDKSSASHDASSEVSSSTPRRRRLSHQSIDEEITMRQRAQSEPDGMFVRSFVSPPALRTTRRHDRVRQRKRNDSASPQGLPVDVSDESIPLTGYISTRQRSHSDYTEVSSPFRGFRGFAEGFPPSNIPADRRTRHSFHSDIMPRSATPLHSDIELSGPSIAAIPSTTDDLLDRADSLLVSSGSEAGQVMDDRSARARWLVINRRFQLTVAVMSLIFSCLLASLVVCWVVLTSAYVVSIEKPCDVPLKGYFWMVTLQLVLDVFRTDIMRIVFRWDSRSNQHVPPQVIAYNVAYLTYAALVLRLGCKSVFNADTISCDETASQLFQASKVFVVLSLAAWTTIILGYLVPFFVVASILTLNGYSPGRGGSSSNQPPRFAVFPSTNGAPSGTIDELHSVTVESIPDLTSKECCICMEAFGNDELVETDCKHIFHKQCCGDWLRQARTCPICRTDIPNAIDARSDGGSRLNSAMERTVRRTPIPRLEFGPAGQPLDGRNFAEVVDLWRMLRQRRRTGFEGGASSSRGISSA